MRLSILFFLALSAAAPALAHVPVQAEQPVGITDYSAAWEAHLMSQREQALVHLQTYAEARIYPINDVQFGALSMLRDPRGTPCAMAYLVEQTGDGHLIDALVSDANDTRFEDLQPGTPLYDWTLRSGLTLEEAAMVQEPDSFIGNDLMELPEDIAQHENERLYTHLSTTTAMLRMQSEAAIQLAMQRLGDRVFTPPPGSSLPTL